MWLRQSGMPYCIESLQRITLLGSGKILKKGWTLNYIKDRTDGTEYPIVTRYSAPFPALCRDHNDRPILIMMMMMMIAFIYTR